MSSPEAELLLLCARVTQTAPQQARVAALLEEGIDWDAFLSLAQRHGLQPLAHRHLESAASVPNGVRGRLWARAEWTATRNRAMTLELLRVLRLFGGAGIAALPYKGPALAAALYGDVALREFGDLDILLPPGEIRRALGLLEADGYQPEYPLSPQAREALLRSRAQYHLSLLHREARTMVELHWKTDALFPVEPVADAAWWRALGEMELLDGRVPCFAPRELLLVLCLHGSKHHWSSVGWLVDIAELLRREPGMDWAWVFGRAREWRCVRRLALGLHLAHRLLDAPLPPQVRDEAAAVPGVASLAGAIVPSLLAPEWKPVSVRENLRRDLLLYDRFSQRRRHVADTVFAPGLPEWSRFPLPRSLAFLWSPLRFARLLGKHVASLLGRS